MLTGGLALRARPPATLRVAIRRRSPGTSTSARAPSELRYSSHGRRPQTQLASNAQYQNRRAPRRFSGLVVRFAVLMNAAGFTQIGKLEILRRPSAASERVKKSAVSGCHPEPPKLRRRSRSSVGRSKDPLPANPERAAASHDASTLGGPSTVLRDSGFASVLRRLRMTGRDRLLR